MVAAAGEKMRFGGVVSKLKVTPSSSFFFTPLVFETYVEKFMISPLSKMDFAGMPSNF